MSLLVALGAFVFTLLGGFLAGRITDKRHLALGAAGGLMLGVITFDIIPEAIDMSKTLNGVSIGMITLVVGFVLVHFFERIGGIHHSHEHEDDHHPTPPSVFALIGHSFLDGLAVGLAFQVDSALGALVALAVITHDISDGFNIRTLTTLYGLKRRKALSLLLTDALAPTAGILVASLFSVSTVILGPLLGLFGGSLLYLATTQILPEAHASHSSRWTFVATAAGILVMFFAIGYMNA